MKGKEKKVARAIKTVEKKAEAVRVVFPFSFDPPFLALHASAVLYLFGTAQLLLTFPPCRLGREEES